VSVTTRVLGAADGPALEAFLARHGDSSMFLRSNARRGGLEYHGRPLEANYAAAFERDGVTAVAAHCWNGLLLVQAPCHLAAVVRLAVAESGRPVSGISGPWDQVVAARAALGLEAARPAKEGREHLFALPLADLVIPPALATRRVACRRPRAAELELLVAWRRAFYVEALELPDTSSVALQARDDVLRLQADGWQWIALAHGTPVAYAALSARVQDAAQVGGVWTPPELRGRGYARAAVAGALLAARADGATRAVLFTDDAYAARAYQALGFRRTGEYGLVLLPDPVLLA
jgi:ribosomal protein S18 acetylase RimI-like enzyme